MRTNMQWLETATTWRQIANNVLGQFISHIAHQPLAKKWQSVASDWQGCVSALGEMC